MFNYVKESYNELVNKVTWPTFPQLQELDDRRDGGLCHLCADRSGHGYQLRKPDGRHL